VLLVRRGTPPRVGQWSIPGGGQELGETVAEAAVREVLEETGISITVKGLIDVVDLIRPSEDPDRTGIEFHYTLIDLAAVWLEGEPVAGDDVTEARWVPTNDLADYILWSETERIIRLAGDVISRKSALAE
ncbi:MAG: NUDIX hydrolase, partial [Rhodospirillales bacterium]